MRSTAAGAGRRRVQRYISWSSRSASATGPLASSGSGTVSRSGQPAWTVAEELDVAQPEERPAQHADEGGLVGGIARAPAGGRRGPPTARDSAKPAAPLTSTGISQRLERRGVAAQRLLPAGQDEEVAAPAAPGVHLGADEPGDGLGVGAGHVAPRRRRPARRAGAPRRGARRRARAPASRRSNAGCCGVARRGKRRGNTVLAQSHSAGRGAEGRGQRDDRAPPVASMRARTRP